MAWPNFCYRAKAFQPAAAATEQAPSQPVATPAATPPTAAHLGPGSPPAHTPPGPGHPPAEAYADASHLYEVFSVPESSGDVTGQQCGVSDAVVSESGSFFFPGASLARHEDSDSSLPGAVPPAGEDGKPAEVT